MKIRVPDVPRIYTRIKFVIVSMCLLLGVWVIAICKGVV